MARTTGDVGFDSVRDTSRMTDDREPFVNFFMNRDLNRSPYKPLPRDPGRGNGRFWLRGNYRKASR